LSLFVITKGDYFRFGLVFIKKKNNQTEIFLKKKPKPVQTGLARFSPVLARLFRFGFGLVWFFWFSAYKTEPAGFFKILIGFFIRFGFFSLISFLVFYSPLIITVNQAGCRNNNEALSISLIMNKNISC
jgi:hypothetical protein